MCGIAGILNFNERTVEKMELVKMANTLNHRGPDGEGFWINSEKNIGFAHKRLAILDLSEAGKQPMSFQNRFTITFNGEIYNYIEIKEFLLNKGYKFHTNTDTEVVLSAYHYYGERCVDYFDGMFAFAIWDEDKKEIFCARDRFGEKPFYYLKNGHQFAFASEMKALFVLGIKKEPNRKKVFEYLLYLNTESPIDKRETFFLGINQLEPSHYMVIKANGEFKQKQYWELNITTTNTDKEEVVIEKFRELFSLSISKRLRSDVEIGSSLSGGLDSSSIVASINKKLNTNSVQHVFSARFPGFVKDEGVHIDNVISNCNNAKILKHEVFPSEESMLKNLEKIMYHQEIPFGSSSISAQFEVMLMASSRVKVLLDGQGADEVLGGYHTYFESYLRGLLISNPIKFFKEKENLKNRGNYINQDSKMAKFFMGYANQELKKVSNYRREKIRNDSEYFKGMGLELVEEFKNVPNPVFKASSLKKHLKFSLMDRGLNELLRYADRNSMANSIEVRLPFLSHKLVEYVFSLPDSFFIKDGWTKFILRKSMDGILPKAIQWRTDKIGFEPPQTNWMQNNFVISKVKEAQQKLIKDKILVDKNHEVNWQHLMLGMLYD